MYVGGNISYFDAKGNSMTPNNIKQIDADSDYEAREEALEALKKDILQNPQKYERTEMLFEVGEEYIHILSAKKVIN
jgi:hypothetical protein